MKKYKKIFEKNIEKNIDKVKEGIELYNKIYKIASDLVPITEKFKNNLKKIASKFIDTREVINMSMFFYYDSIENNEFNEEKFKDYVSSFVELLGSNPVDNDELKDEFLANKDTDELGFDVYDRYYYESIKPYFDMIYKNQDNLEKSVFKVFKEKSKLTKDDFFTFMVLRGHDQGIVVNIGESYNKQYKASYFKKEDSLRLLKNSLLNTMGQTTLRDAVMDYDIKFTNDPNKVNLPEENINMVVDFYKNQDSLQIDVNPKVYQALRKKEPNKKEFYKYRDTYAYPMYNFFDDTLISVNNTLQAKFKNDKFEHIFIDGVKLTEIEENSFTQSSYLAKAMCEGTHAIDTVVMLDDGNGVYPKIVPVKFNHNFKEYNKGHLGLWNRILNLFGIRDDIVDIEKIENKNFRNQQRNTKERYDKIYESLAKDIAKANEKSEVKIEFRCPNEKYSIHLDNRINLDLNLDNNIIDRNNINELNLKKDDIVRKA